MKKRSFFERLTGSVNMDEEEMELDEEVGAVGRADGRDNRDGRDARIENRVEPSRESRFAPKSRGIFGRARDNDEDRQIASTWNEEPTGEGELSLDVFQTPDDIIVRAMIPGVRKDDMDISISRDSITIKGSRKEDKIISDQDYVVRELYWGTFSRTVAFPHEVDIEHAEATENQGMLTIKLPRIDKERQTKLRIKSI
ncbi:MAG: Hsp20/alpha crystallin family protein [Candidatus Pacebacteria bacterium]|jgi:HSP20 family protein|nr:Hsp20/alpha crystallin family protein [Candidatus Paceibacterota bacterium]MBP9819041.1 Hsp20/alpha crystallin family protein [Candidatus Paceibacterota bacterium]